jgi:glutamate decarboxylase
VPHYSSTRDLEDGIDIRPQFSRDGAVVDIPRRRMSKKSVDPETAYAVINDELMLDGHARLNVATFGTTWMEPQAEQLMADAADKNLVDRDEYPQTAQLEDRCLDIIADFWNAPEPDNPIGCSTIGSSEACMLAGMALKWRWRDRQKEAGRPADRPNLVVGSNVQVCWHKFCRYWEVEPKEVTIRKGETTMHPDDVAAACDENTIGVVGILGSTFDGAYEDIAGMAKALVS